MKRKRAFTLLELMIAVFVIGILASLMYFNYAWFIEKARGAEAREVLLKAYGGWFRLVMEGEVINASSPLTWNRMGLDGDPNAVARANFTYTITPNANSPTGIRAVRVGNSGLNMTIRLSDGFLNKTNPY